jgi:hypothetical protein
VAGNQHANVSDFNQIKKNLHKHKPSYSLSPTSIAEAKQA